MKITSKKEIYYYADLKGWFSLYVLKKDYKNKEGHVYFLFLLIILFDMVSLSSSTINQEIVHVKLFKSKKSSVILNVNCDTSNVLQNAINLFNIDISRYLLCGKLKVYGLKLISMKSSCHVSSQVL